MASQYRLIILIRFLLFVFTILSTWTCTNDSRLEPLVKEDFHNDCSYRSYRTCYQKDVHIYDPCYDSYTLQERCAEPNGQCVDDGDGTAYCKCRNHWYGVQCDQCPDRWSLKDDCNRCVDGRGDIDADDECLTCVRYVKQNIESDQTKTIKAGFSWETAFASIQEAIDDAAEESDCEVWVAEGIYYIYSSSPGDTLKMRDHVEVYGGFIGNETSREERDWTRHKTILDGQAKTNSGNRVHHVITGAEGAVLDGFVVKNGRADTENSEYARGGGLISDGCSVTIEHCEFANNYAEDKGGAIYIANAVVAKVKHTTFENNQAYSGAALYVTESSISIIGSIFKQNKADPGDGGAISLFSLIDLSRLSKIVNCGFRDNQASGRGGAIYMSESDMEVTNCSFTSNMSGTADGGGAIRYVGSNNLSITNSILWGDSPDEISLDSEDLLTVDIRSSDIEGIDEYMGNFSQDPSFVMGDDVSLPSLSLGPFSPCIDKADGEAAPATDIDSQPRCDHPQYSNYFDCSNAFVSCSEFADIGAYEVCSF